MCVCVCINVYIQFCRLCVGASSATAAPLFQIKTTAIIHNYFWLYSLTSSYINVFASPQSLTETWHVCFLLHRCFGRRGVSFVWCPATLKFCAVFLTLLFKQNTPLLPASNWVYYTIYISTIYTTIFYVYYPCALHLNQWKKQTLESGRGRIQQLCCWSIVFFVFFCNFWTTVMLLELVFFWENIEPLAPLPALRLDWPLPHFQVATDKSIYQCIKLQNVNVNLWAMFLGKQKLSCFEPPDSPTCSSLIFLLHLPLPSFTLQYLIISTTCKCIHIHGRTDAKLTVAGLHLTVQTLQSVSSS